MHPLRNLYEVSGLPTFDLPRNLEELYDGALGFNQRITIANFVSSLDGVVAIPSAPASSSVISGKNEADRFVMGLLRACSGAVLVGAGTVRAEPAHRWTPEHIFPKAADDFARLRRSLGLAVSPELAILTSSGVLDAEMPALEGGALILTTKRGARRLTGRLPAGCEIVDVGRGTSVDPSDALSVITDRGHETVMSEGGPTLMGQLLEDRLVDELFLTLSPMLAGRTESEPRPGIVEGVDLAPTWPWSELLSVRRHASHLFLRYGLSKQSSVEV